MAREGLRFADGYSPSPLCSASRAAIFTGKTPHRLGITGAIDCRTNCVPIDKPSLDATAAGWQRVVTPSYLTQLPLGERTVAEYLREAGYATAHVGKWHLGGAAFSASAQGFDTVIGGGDEPAPGSHFSPFGVANIPGDVPGEYLSDRLTDESEVFIRAKANRPFFLSLSHYGVHVPLQGPADLTAEYAERRDARNGQQNATYGAMVEKIDQSLGRILELIDALGLGTDTVVILTSDNGGLVHTSPDSFLRRITSTGPFRGGKAHIYEGGIRVPMFFRWPSRIAAGAVSDVPVSGIDIMPTVLDIAGLPAAEVEGISLRGLFDVTRTRPDRSLVWHFPHYNPSRLQTAIPRDDLAMASLPASAIRRGHYKLVRVYGEGPTTAEASEELYDLSVDPGEVRNIAATRPDLVAELGALLTADLTANGALVPVANPAFHETLDGWRAVKHAKATITRGELMVAATAEDPQLVSSKILLSEPGVLRIRMRSARKTTIQLLWSNDDSPKFDRARSVSLVVAAGSINTDNDLAVPATQTSPVRWLRLDTGSLNDIIHIDEMSLLASASPNRMIQRWRFNGLTGLGIAGSWFAERDTFLALGPGSLQIDMSGTAPSILSPPVTLFASMVVKIRMRSTGAGRCTLGWSLPLDYVSSTARTVGFDVPHDGLWHEHTLQLAETSESPVQRMLLTLGSAMGVAEIDFIQVFDTQASLVATWEFGPGQASA
jgi:arylsulfatase A-like enzyme